MRGYQRISRGRDRACPLERLGYFPIPPPPAPRRTTTTRVAARSSDDGWHWLQPRRGPSPLPAAFPSPLCFSLLQPCAWPPLRGSIARLRALAFRFDPRSLAPAASALQR